MLAMPGSVEEAWFDSNGVLDSDWSDDDFQSVPDGVQKSYLCLPSIVYFDTDKLISTDMISLHSFDGTLVPGSFDNGKSDSKLRSDEPLSGTIPVFVDEISCSAGETGGGDDGLLDNLLDNCLPCLASTVNNVEKRRSLSSSPPSFRKKAALKLPFKWKDGNPTAALCEC